MRTRKVVVIGQVLLQKSPEVEGPGKDSAGRPHRPNAVGVDQLEADGYLPPRGLDHLRQEETGKVIADHDASVLRQCAKQPFAGARFLLDVGQISDLVDSDSGIHIILRTA